MGRAFGYALLLVVVLGLTAVAANWAANAISDTFNKGTAAFEIRR